MANYQKCRFCKDDAVTVFDIKFHKSPMITVGVCTQHKEYVVNKLLYVCDCGELTALGLRHVCKEADNAGLSHRVVSAFG